MLAFCKPLCIHVFLFYTFASESRLGGHDANNSNISSVRLLAVEIFTAQPGVGLHSGLGTFLAFVAPSSSLVRFEPGALPFALRLTVQIGVPIPCLPPYCVGG